MTAPGSQCRVGITVAQFWVVINLVDLFIIYLACGAPFAVYYFTKNRTRSGAPLFGLKTLFVFLVWMPFAFRLLPRRRLNFKTSAFGFGKTHSAVAKLENELYTVQKELEGITATSDLKISIYEFRETVERYAGLTFAAHIDDAGISEHEREIFRVSEKNNSEVGAICLNRRNRERLFFHQSLARKDFLHLVGQLLECDCSEFELESATVKFVGLLKDAEAKNRLEKIFAGRAQTGNFRNVKKSEKDLWKREMPKPLPSRTTSPQLQTLNQTISSRRKD